MAHTCSSPPTETTTPAVWVTYTAAATAAASGRGANASVPAAAADLAVAEVDAGDDDDAGDDAVSAPTEDAVGRLLADAWSALEAVAAAGVAANRDWDRFAREAQRADELGLAVTARRLRRVGEAARADAADRDRAVARAVLAAAWVVRLTESAALVERAAAVVDRAAVILG